MRKFLLLLITFFAVQIASAQKAPNINDGVIIDYESVDIKPVFPGGYDAFTKYIGKNLVLPDVENLNGIVKISFVIETTGKVNSIKIIKDLGEGTGEEVKRVMSKCPNWTPGEHGGEIVNVIFTLPITIKVSQ